MNSLLSNSISVGQVGEYLVASHLCRMGLVATTFTRNMPGFDILALNSNIQLKIQVKTVRNKGDWQLNASDFLIFDKDLFEKGTQKIVGINNIEKCDFFVFVKLDKDSDLQNKSVEELRDRFYIVPTKKLKIIIMEIYNNFLIRNDGVRPSNQKSTHTAVKKEVLENFENNWTELLKFRIENNT